MRRTEKMEVFRNTRCIDGRIMRHDPQPDDPDLETDVGECTECHGSGGCEGISSGKMTLVERLRADVTRGTLDQRDILDAADEIERLSREGIRQEVLVFARLMEKELRANDHKRGWKNDSAVILAQRVREEADELWEAAKAYCWNYPNSPRACDREIIAEEAADVANMAMMVADVSGCLGS